jgi:Fur family transcriptional regulator, ferric uptake regulator
MLEGRMRRHEPQSPLDQLSLDTIIEFLRQQGLRITESRTRILQVLLHAKKPLSLSEIHERSATGGSGPDYATVFRVMTQLEKLHIVQRVNLNRSCAYYELLDPERHTDRIVCTECGKTAVIVNACPVSKIERQIEKEYGFSDIHHSLEFFGRCSDCA